MSLLNEKKRLGIFINSLGSGGAERVASILANQLHEEFVVTIILLNRVISYPLDANVNIEVIFSSNGFLGKIKDLLFSPFKLDKVLRKNNIQSLLVFLYRPAFLSVITKRILRWKGVILISERTYTLSHYNPKTIKGRIGLWLIKAFYNEADLILPNSKLTAHSLKEDIGIVAPIQVIYNPIISPQSHSEYYSDGPIEVLNVGNFYDYKNHEMLLKALAASNTVNWHLNLVGTGPLKTKLLKLSDELKIRDKVAFHGRADSYLFYPKADVYISTSSIEGFPNALVEAMAHGLPVIATDCKSGPREILCPKSDFRKLLNENDQPEYAEYGILVPINNARVLSLAFNKFVADATMIRHYKKRSVLRASDFSYHQIINQFKTVINDTICK
jgi:N-acetylgalactosamine-N,N'-diacetylbacillosaminyl-diphospho-undecaprenol 4-alpha-N-acetylgalactosaminyltransferase